MFRIVLTIFEIIVNLGGLVLGPIVLLPVLLHSLQSKDRRSSQLSSRLVYP